MRWRRFVNRLGLRPQKELIVAVVVAAVAATMITVVSGTSDNDDGKNPSAAATAVGSSPSPAPSPQAFTIAATGDILVHGAVAERAEQYAAGSSLVYDFRPMFASIRPFIAKADLGICHQETPISFTNEGISSYPLFNAPRQLGLAIASSGFDACSTASNHALDQGFDGVASTLRVLDRVGVQHAGTTTSRGEEVAHLEVKGNSVALLSYTYGTNGIPLPDGKPWAVNLIKFRRIVADARREETAGADLIVLALHWGLEYQSEPTPDQLSLARRLARSGSVDLIIGHHAHVVQPIRKIHGLYVIFGLGNILSNQRAGATATCCLPQTQDGMIAHIDVSVRDGELQVTDVDYRPTWVDPTDIRVVPVAEELKGETEIPEEELHASWSRTTSTLRASSAGVKPVTRP